MVDAASTISVVGTGRAAGPPDTVRIRLTATAIRPTLAAALADSEDAARRVRAALATQGVAAEDATTEGLSVQAEQVFSEHEGSRITGFRSAHELTITLRDLPTAGRLLGDVIVAGGDDVRLHGVDFVVEDDVHLREQAREAAWGDARRRAEQLAALAARRLGDVRRITEGTPEEVGLMDGGVRAMAASSVDMGVQPGTVSVEVSLAVTWELV